jgi:hypothetical protein
MPTFCRHNRFLERCPICSKTLPGNSPAARPSGASRRHSSGSSRAGAARRGTRGPRISIRHQQRAAEDGYRSELLPGLRASLDAARLAEEIAFSHGRLLALAARPPDPPPPDLYSEVRVLAESDLEAATWACFLIAYLCPLGGTEPFAGIRTALGTTRRAPADFDELALDELPLGPRTSHDPARGAATLEAYRKWYEQAGGSESDRSEIGLQQLAFTGDSSWTPERRFERLFERLALPGFTRAARYELLVLLGALGLYDVRAGSLFLAGARGGASDDPATLAAKRVFAIGDQLLLDRRAAALAEAIPVPVEALELALANWASGERATLGFPPETRDDDTLQHARDALGI